MSGNNAAKTFLPYREHVLAVRHPVGPHIHVGEVALDDLVPLDVGPNDRSIHFLDSRDLRNTSDLPHLQQPFLPPQHVPQEAEGDHVVWREVEVW